MAHRLHAPTTLIQIFLLMRGVAKPIFEKQATSEVFRDRFHSKYATKKVFFQ